MQAGERKGDVERVRRFAGEAGVRSALMGSSFDQRSE